MPGIIACKRRWGLGSDDLLFPALTESTLRTSWLVVVAVLFWKHGVHQECPGDRLLHLYLMGLQVLLAIVITINAAIIWLSMRGTITNTKPRRHIPFFLYMRVVMIIPEIGWHSLGTLWAFRTQETCEPDDVLILIQVATFIGWILIISILFGLYIVFDPAGSVKHCRTNNGTDLEMGPEAESLFLSPSEKGQRRLQKSWLKRVKLLFCCVRFEEQSEQAYRDVADMIAGYFNDVDLVPSDIAAGLILLRKKQRKLMALTGTTSEQQGVPLPIPYSTITTTDEPITDSKLEGVVTRRSWMTPESALHYMRFAWGCYGWPAFMFSHLCTGMCMLWGGIRCCACFREKNQSLIGDNCCECHTATVKRLSRVPPEDLLHISFHNSVYEVPFYVALDHKTQSVVVTVRGTLSMGDTLTDLTADCDELKVDGFPSGSLCHKGMLKCASYIKRELETHKVLVSAFEKHPTYQLIVTGHSLGAGTASVLSILLKPSYPDLRCYAFSPPGGMFDYNLAKLTENFIFSVVIGDDIVPRLGIVSMEVLKRQLLTCLLECDKPKHQVLLKGCWSVLCGTPATPLTSEMSSPVKTPPLLSPQALTHDFKSKTPEKMPTKTISPIVQNATPKSITKARLFPPGKILYLTESVTGYNASWAAAEYFDHIVISPNMMIDHLPDVVYRALRIIVKSSEIV